MMAPAYSPTGRRDGKIQVLDMVVDPSAAIRGFLEHHWVS